MLRNEIMIFGLLNNKNYYKVKAKAPKLIIMHSFLLSEQNKLDLPVTR